MHTRTYISSTATVATTERRTRISITTSTTWSCTTRTESSPAPVTATQRLKTATDLGALAQAAGAVTPTALVGKRRSSTQNPYVKRSNSHPTPRPTATSTISHPILVEQRNPRALQELQEHQSWDQVVPIAQVLREELRQDLRLSRREESPLYPKARIHVEANDATAQVLTQGRQGEQGRIRQVTAVSGKSSPRADQDTQAPTCR